MICVINYLLIEKNKQVEDVGQYCGTPFGSTCNEIKCDL